MWMELTQVDQKGVGVQLIWINLDRAVLMIRQPPSTLVSRADDTYWRVLETPEEIIRRMKYNQQFLDKPKSSEAQFAEQRGDL